MQLLKGNAPTSSRMHSARMRHQPFRLIGNVQQRRGRTIQPAAGVNLSVDALQSLQSLQGLQGMNLGTMPKETLIAGAAVVIAGLAGIMSMQNMSSQGTTEDSSQAASAPSATVKELPRKDAVLVLGATGRVGRRVVQKLLAAGRTVVALERSAGKAEEAFAAVGVKEGKQSKGKGILFVERGIDITDTQALASNESLWKGVTQVVSCLGAVAGPLPGGGFGYLDNMTPERVEGTALPALLQLLADKVGVQKRIRSTILPMGTDEDRTKWERLDDVIMGGQSASSMEAIPEKEGEEGTLWKGNLILEGGGFCGMRSKKLGLNLSQWDGIHLRVKGDGQIFKFNVKTTDQEDVPESTYQATFDTVDGQWADVFIPWNEFVPVARAQSDPKGKPLDPSKISKFGLVLSRFEFNKAPNPSYHTGEFELRIKDGIQVFKDPRPQVVMVSAASVERNALIGDDEQARKADIPIVQLNPGGTLNYKYAAEAAVRASGFPYAVVRFTGMVDAKEDEVPCLLEADQGDTIVGTVTRDEAADVVSHVVNSPAAIGKTFEVRRSEAADAKGKSMKDADYLRMFLKLALDRNRWRVGLKPFPKPVPPPAPVTDERRQEIVAQVAQVRAERGTTPAAAPGSSTHPMSARQWIDAWKARSGKAVASR